MGQASGGAVHPHPATSPHQCSARARQLSRSRNCPPARKFDLTCATQRSTRGLSADCGCGPGPPRTPAEECPASLEPGDHIAQRLSIGGVDERVSRLDRGEDQPMHHPAPAGGFVGEHPEPTERSSTSPQPAAPLHVHSGETVNFSRCAARRRTIASRAGKFRDLSKGVRCGRMIRTPCLQ